MCSSMSSESTTSDGWTPIEFHSSRHTKDRTPEYNDDNEPSAQDVIVSSSSYDADLTSENAQGDNAAGTFEIPYRGRSHGCSMETASSDQTFFADGVMNHQETLATAPPLTASQSLPKGPPLTASVLRRYSEVMAQPYIGNIPSWIEGDGFVGLFAGPEVSEYPPTTKPPKSKHSISSNDGSDFAYVSSPQEQANLIAGCGGWCGESDGRDGVSTFDLLEDLVLLSG
ncbi:hypothetical protein QBC32DRAFT_125632 [Pseudoneurospora amorphoporcata]|uniref:Uncharacterized protein n=1 Tax=Pseudoneurospora amorphoporcata TaxID=241081 RepID=A0AAN6NW37_9PEZI|nr:hypothetical protein QBC32DRAFT_125632 [Pseudoneurospora amorphoporcata]